MKWIIYTCIVDEYDTLLPVLGNWSDAKFFVLSPTKPKFNWNWTWIPMPKPFKAGNPAAYNRYFKFFPQRIFGQVSGTVYVDGNVLIKHSLAPLIHEFKKSNKPVGLFRHCARSTIEQELHACIEKQKINASEHVKFLKWIKKCNLQDQLRTPILTENSIIFRRHCDYVEKVGDELWKLFERGIRRDQLILPLILNQQEPKAHIWSWNFRSKNQYFSVPTGHRRSASVISDAIFGLRVLRAQYINGEISISDIRAALNT